jgi:plastocyanin
MQNLVPGIIGIILLLIVVGGLLYIFRSRTNAVEKNGYGALIMLAIVALLIPVFWIQESSNHAAAVQSQFTVNVQRGLIDYVNNCTNNCFGIANSKVVNPTYNGYGLDYFNSLTDDQLTAVVAGGQYNPKAVNQPASLNAIPRSDEFGGGLSSNDVQNIVDFLRSADPTYLKQNGYPMHNGFDDLPAYLQANNQNQYDAAVTFAQTGQFGTPKDLTNQKTVAMNIVTPGTAGVTCQSQQGCYQYISIKVKVGTTITWTNTSKLGHTVTAIKGTNTASPTPDPTIFDSSKGTSALIQPGQKFSYTVTLAAYNADPTTHHIIYYCKVHPDMLAQITITK